MRWRTAGLGLAMLLAACEAPSPQVPETQPSTADTPRARALVQLRSRLGADPALTNLRQGTHEGKAVLCGDATVGDGTATPFVMRGGYLVLPVDASPDQFATLQAMCTEPGPAPAP